MKVILMVIFFLAVLSSAGMIDARAQTVDCPAGYVCLTQEVANRSAAALAELIEARKVIAEYAKGEALSKAEREAAAVLIKRLNEAVAMGDSIIAMQKAALDTYAKIVQLQADLLIKFEERLSKPKSAFAKFMDTLKTVGNIMLGIAIGRAL